MDADEQVIGFDIMEAADMDAMIEVVSHRVCPSTRHVVRHQLPEASATKHDEYGSSGSAN